MAEKNILSPDCIFETSWEVCNKVGGIYTVLSTRAKTLQEKYPDKVIFIGPDFVENEDFIECQDIFDAWKSYVEKSDILKIRIGRWNVPGKPIAILIDPFSFYSHKNEIYFQMWKSFGVKSLNAYGDYDESCIFAIAVGKMIESFYKFYQLEKSKVIAHFNEWTVGMGALYLKQNVPAIATVFTTHATSIGRSIAGNNKPLYEYFNNYNGDQMAEELNMEAKHSLEKQTAWNVDAFTTVSDITACECAQLLERVPNVVTPNGFEDNFVPKGRSYTMKRKAARKKMLEVARKLTGKKINDDALLLATCGRYEYKNKGIDVFIEAMNRIRLDKEHKKQIVAFILVPAWIKGPREDLKERLNSKEEFDIPLDTPYLTHELCEPYNDKVCNYLRYLNFDNRNDDPVTIVFVPSYLNKEEGIFNMPYYDVLPGLDLTVFPSYYEPWGYTPLESIAFGIPTITTNLAGFGLWAVKEEGSFENMQQGVDVLSRTDGNYFEVAEKIKKIVMEYAVRSKDEVDSIRAAASELSERASWEHFIQYYYSTYDIALKNAALRIKNKKK